MGESSRKKSRSGGPSQLLSGTTVSLKHLPSRVGGQHGAHHEDGKWVKAECASLQCLEAELELQGPGN